MQVLNLDWFGYPDEALADQMNYLRTEIELFWYSSITF